MNKEAGKFLTRMWGGHNSLKISAVLSSGFFSVSVSLPYFVTIGLVILNANKNCYVVPPPPINDTDNESGEYQFK
jgi:hypothetical protein